MNKCRIFPGRQVRMEQRHPTGRWHRDWRARRGRQWNIQLSFGMSLKQAGKLRHGQFVGWILPNTSPHPFGSAPIHYSAPWSLSMVQHMRLPKGKEVIVNDNVSDGTTNKSFNPVTQEDFDNSLKVLMQRKNEVYIILKKKCEAVNEKLRKEYGELHIEWFMIK